MIRSYQAVQSGEVDVGLLIPEGPIAYPQHGLIKVIDLWHWWYERTKLPLPRDINAIKS